MELRGAIIDFPMRLMVTVKVSLKAANFNMQLFGKSEMSGLTRHKPILDWRIDGHLVQKTSELFTRQYKTRKGLAYIKNDA